MLAGDACAEPRAAAFALLEQTSAVAATSADVGTGTSVKQNFDGIVAFPALPRSSIVCEPQAALVRTYGTLLATAKTHEEMANRAAHEGQLRADEVRILRTE